LGFGGGDVNLYAYVKNSPVNRNDPRGTNTIAVGGVIGEIVGGPPGAVIGAATGAVVGAVVGAVIIHSFRDTADLSDCDQEWEDAY
jgi:outer membrane lipoprotein SlyB